MAGARPGGHVAAAAHLGQRIAELVEHVAAQQVDLDAAEPRQRRRIILGHSRARRHALERHSLGERRTGEHDASGMDREVARQPDQAVDPRQAAAPALGQAARRGRRHAVGELVGREAREPAFDRVARGPERAQGCR